MIDLRFPTALHMMQSLILAERAGTTYVNSGQFAEGLRANPTLVRKLLNMLVRDGLLASRMGRSGGVRLARSAERITLREIYEASVSGKRLWTTRTDLPHRCVVSTNFERYFSSLASAADQAVLEMLEGQTLAQSFAALEELDRSDGRTRPACSEASSVSI